MTASTSILSMKSHRLWRTISPTLTDLSSSTIVTCIIYKMEKSELTKKIEKIYKEYLYLIPERYIPRFHYQMYELTELSKKYKKGGK